MSAVSFTEHLHFCIPAYPTLLYATLPYATLPCPALLFVDGAIAVAADHTMCYQVKSAPQGDSKVVDCYINAEWNTVDSTLDKVMIDRSYLQFADIEDYMNSGDRADFRNNYLDAL